MNCASANDTVKTRSTDTIWLVGGMQEAFSAVKLPSRGEVLRVMFHYHNNDKLSLRDSIAKTTELLLPVWERARIPTKAPTHVVEHIRKLHAEWQNLKKLVNRKSQSNLLNQQVFTDSLHDLFDIAHQNALDLIKIEEDRQFLMAQREKGRRGCMAGVDRILAQKEERIMKRKAAEANRAAKAADTSFAAAAAIMEMASSSSSESEEPEMEEPLLKTPRQSKHRGTITVVTPEVAAALDRTNTSNRNAAYIFSALASTSQLQHDSSQLITSHSAIRRARIKHRENIALELKATFQPTVPLILHWDGKIMDDFTGLNPGKVQVDRLPILVSGENIVKLLSVPKLHSGTADVTATAIMNVIDEWGLQDRIRGFCFDTTATNSGAKGGICILLESFLHHDVLNLACRHHISEIVLQAVFGLNDVSKSADIEIFMHFRDYWPRIDQASFSTALQDDTIAPVVMPWKDDIIEFARHQMEQSLPRDDYKELLELSIIFLGGTPSNGIQFRYPGAVHRARWMSRAIYSLKMWLFRHQFHLQQPSHKTRREAYSQKVWDNLREMCLFTTKVYMKYWFQSPCSAAAPRNDLIFLCELSTYSDKRVGEAATKAFGRHLWYLSELLIGFSFFDDEVTPEEKRLMVTALKETDGSEKPPKRIQLFSDPQKKSLHEFVTKSTHGFFSLLDLSTDFLDTDPIEWNTQEAYLKSQETVCSVRVVNDLAERGVALIQQFNSSLTRDEEQKQYLLQVVEQHRKHFSAPTKSGLQ